jgi:mycofactocin system glycosyltransferase
MIVKGSFHLQPLIHLIPETGKDATGGGIVFQSSPMRVLRMNGAAFSILKKCQSGYSVEAFQEKTGDHLKKTTIPFLDALCQAQILEWKPPAEKYEPFVSIVIPVYNRSHDLYCCLESLKTLDYPQSKLQVIVVDDASNDNSASVAGEFNAKVIVQPYNQGQSAARNRGVKEASGEIVAFIDSDCIADPQWLKDLVPYFQDRRFVLVGGFVDSYYQNSMLDRYESVKSALNMGMQKVVGVGNNAVFYVPTCNVLIRKDIYLKNGGLDESMRVGEDVDFCWRLMKAGHRLIYVPKGKVRHKHRNQFLSCFMRRFDYGTSEPILYSKYPETMKRFPWQAGGMVFFLFFLMGLVLQSVIFFLAAVVLLFSEGWYKKIQVKNKFKTTLPLRTILWGSLRSHFLFSYYLTNHITRYYVLLLVLLPVISLKMIPLTAAIALLPVLVEFFQKKPRLNLPMFIFYYWMEQIFYQAGVLRGCFRERSFRLYRISFAHAGFLKSENPFLDRVKSVFQNRR